MIGADALAAILDRKDLLDGGQKGDQNNLALADQFQFSSLLKLYVTPPEKEIQQAQGGPGPAAKSVKLNPRDPEAAKAPQPKQADRSETPKDTPPTPRSTDNDGPQVKFDPADAKQDLSHAADGKENDKPENVQAPADKPKVKDGGKVEEKVEAPKVSDDDLDVAAVIATANTKPVAPAAADAPVAPIPTTAQTSEAPKPAPAPAAQPKANPGQAALIAAALAGDNSADDGKLADAVANAKSGADAPKTPQNNHSNPEVARQAADLSQRLGLSPEPKQVSVTVNTTTANPTPKPHLAPSAVSADPGTGDKGAQAFTTSQGKPDGSHIAPDRSADTRGAPPPNANAFGLTVPQGDFLNAGQAVRAQAFTVGAQNAAPAAQMATKAQPAVVEPTPISGPAGVGGTGQVSDTTKTVPTQAPRQPVPTRSPAEQIAIQIQKGIGAGADKISIKLHPEHLGRVEVKLEVGKDGHLTAAISADKPDTLNLLQRDSRILERALQEAGLQTDSNSLSFMLRGDGSNQALPEDRGTGASGPLLGDAGLADVKIEDVAAANVAYGLNVAADGHVDITV